MTQRFTTTLLAFAFAAAPAFAQDCASLPTSAGSVDLAYADCGTPPGPIEISGPTNLAFGWDSQAPGPAFNTLVQNAPGTLTQVGGGFSPPSAFLGAGDFQGDDTSTWFWLDSGTTFGSANTVTGATAVINGASLSGATGMSWDNTNSTMYVSTSVCGANSELRTINLATGVGALVGGMGASATCVIGIATDPNTGNLYGYDIVSDNFLSINKATGAAAVVGPIGFDANFGQGLDFDNNDGMCYMYAFNNATFVAELRTCNPATGATALIGTIGGTVPGGLHQFGAGSSMTQIVPVELVSFSATTNGSNVSLNWVTASETNNAGFEVQMLIGESWNALGFVDGHGTTTEAQNYSFGAELGVGTHSFRLKQIDFDGQFEYHGSVEATIETPGSHVLSAAYPNPFNPQSNFTLAVAQDQNVTAELFNTLGQRVAVLFNGTVEANQTQTLTIDGAGLASGMYVVRVNGERFVDALTVTLLK